MEINLNIYLHIFFYGIQPQILLMEYVLILCLSYERQPQTLLEKKYLFEDYLYLCKHFNWYE